MSIRTYISRRLKYVFRGTPVAQVKVDICKLANNELLTGKTALITGGTSGIGFAIADAFLNAGAKVFITGRNMLRIDDAINKLKKNHVNAVISGLVLDNSNVEQISVALNDLLGSTDIDILVNNAGINGGALDRCTEREYQLVMDTNLKGTVFITQIISNDMVKKGIKGNILNICSSSSNRPANSAYVLSKWGMRGYTLGMAKTLIKYGIVVNGLAPGPTATPMLQKNDASDISLPNNPSGRFALPEEIANMAVVLTSKMGRMVVGDIIYMTGGAGVITFDDIKY